MKPLIVQTRGSSRAVLAAQNRPSVAQQTEIDLSDSSIQTDSMQMLDSLCQTEDLINETQTPSNISIDLQTDISAFQMFDVVTQTEEDLFIIHLENFKPVEQSTQTEIIEDDVYSSRIEINVHTEDESVKEETKNIDKVLAEELQTPATLEIFAENDFELNNLDEDIASSSKEIEPSSVSPGGFLWLPFSMRHLQFSLSTVFPARNLVSAGSPMATLLGALICS